MSGKAEAKRVAILGAAGRDFHNFNMLFRDDPGAVVADARSYAIYA